LNQLSAFWFDRIAGFCPSHYISTDMEQVRHALRPYAPDVPEEQLEGRSMVVHKAQAFPVECVVRGYLEGSAWKEYRQSRSVCGIPLPEGLVQGSRLPEAIFTPSSKAQTGHDENITREEM